MPPVAPQATWRNRLAYAIYNAEAALGPDDQLPWAMLGLPVALIGFDPGIAWAANTALAAGQFITDPNGNIQTVQTAGTTGATEPTVEHKVGRTHDRWLRYLDQQRPRLETSLRRLQRGCARGRVAAQPLCSPRAAGGFQQWQPQTQFAVNAFIIDPNGNMQIATVAATTGAVPPPWASAFGQTTTDGAVTWNNNGPAAWQPNTTFAAGQFIFDSNGNQQFVYTPGVSATTEPDWNGVYLPTTDGTVTWLNNGSGNPPVVQPALAQARINQLSEQLSQILAAGGVTGKTLADYCPTLPPCGVVPAASLNFTNQTAPWFPANWTISAGPVLFEELETVLETGMLMDPISALTAAPEDSDDLEPVEVLVPLPDTLYDPNILVTDTVPQIFYQELNQATAARNLTLQQLATVQEELNTLYTAIGPDVPANPNLINPNTGLTADEIASRDTPPPYTPQSSETFGTVLQATWQPSSPYNSAIPAQFVIDSNGAIQVATTTGSSALSEPAWNTTIGQTTADGVVWISRGKTAWQAKTQFIAGALILDPSGHIQQVQTGGTSGATAPTWNEAANGTTVDDAVTWKSLGNTPWQASTAYSLGHAIIDPNSNIEVVSTAGTSGSSAPGPWNQQPGQTTTDGSVTWTNTGHADWLPNTAYSVGNVIIDSTGTLQSVTVAGTSGTTAPTWNTPQGRLPRHGLQWIDLGNPTWAANTQFAANAVVLDSSGTIQQVQSGGTSGATAPSWSETTGSTTADASITWLNNGPWAWQPNTVYAPGQFVVSPQGFRQTALSNGTLTNGTSASQPPAWLAPKPAGTITTDGAVKWEAMGGSYWQPETSYAAGVYILDGTGNIQEVQTAGVSGAKAPRDPNLNQATQDNTVVWKNVGHAAWTAGLAYTLGQAIIDSSGSIQVVTTAGTSAATAPDWLSESATTPDGILWQSGGSATWQPDFLYATGQLVLDANNNIQMVQTGGISGDSVPKWNPNAGQTTQDSGVVWNNLGHSLWQAEHFVRGAERDYRLQRQHSGRHHRRNLRPRAAGVERRRKLHHQGCLSDLAQRRPHDLDAEYFILCWADHHRLQRQPAICDGPQCAAALRKASAPRRTRAPPFRCGIPPHRGHQRRRDHLGLHGLLLHQPAADSNHCRLRAVYVHVH